MDNKKKIKKKLKCAMMKQSCSKCGEKVIFTYEFGLCGDCFNKLPKKDTEN